MEAGTRLPRATVDGLRIPIAVSNGEGHVWDVEDVKRLRCEHHICGILSGTLPQVSQQNVFLGLPLRLLPEEVVLLVENGIATLIDDEAAHRTPTEEQAEALFQAREDDIDTQRRSLWRAHQQRKAWVQEHFKIEISTVREKRRQEREAKSAGGLEESVFNTADDAVSASSSTAPVGGDEPTSEELANMHHFVSIQHRSDPVLSPFYEPSLHQHETLERARRAGIWTFPNTLQERARCGVFRALWERGRFIGRGIKFGCDFLVYPGDTLRYHSHFSCTVVPSPITAINPLDIVAFGRLATNVKKAHLLAAWDDETKEVTFMSLEWAGMG